MSNKLIILRQYFNTFLHICLLPLKLVTNYLALVAYHILQPLLTTFRLLQHLTTRPPNLYFIIHHLLFLHLHTSIIPINQARFVVKHTSLHTCNQQSTYMSFSLVPNNINSINYLNASQYCCYSFKIKHTAFYYLDGIYLMPFL